MAGKMSDLVPDYCTHPDELVGETEGLRGQQTEHDSKVTARLPGDGLQGHLFDESPNPYLTLPRARTKALLAAGALPADEERLARRALALLQVQHSDMTCEGGGYNPPH